MTRFVPRLGDPRAAEPARARRDGVLVAAPGVGAFRALFAMLAAALVAALASSRLPRLATGTT